MRIEKSVRRRRARELPARSRSRPLPKRTTPPSISSTGARSNWKKGFIKEGLVTSLPNLDVPRPQGSGKSEFRALLLSGIDPGSARQVGMEIAQNRVCLRTADHRGQRSGIGLLHGFETAKVLQQAAGGQRSNCRESPAVRSCDRESRAACDGRSRQSGAPHREPVAPGAAPANGDRARSGRLPAHARR